MFFKNKRKKITLIITLVISLVLITNFSFARDVKTSDITSIVDFIKYLFKLGALGCLIMSLGAFVYNLIRLGASSTNAQKREQAIRGLIISGTVAALVPVAGILYFIIIQFMSLY